MGSKLEMTAYELEQMITQMQKVFTVVRVLDDELISKIDVKAGELHFEACKCYEFWERGDRCENCVAQRALLKKGQSTKIEFIGTKMYQVIAKYIEVECQRVNDI